MTRDTARRMDELQHLAEADGEPCNPASRRDLELFLGEPWVTAYPILTLYDNGCYRAQWQDSRGQLAGIQFRGEHIVHIVFFFRPFGQTFISRISGRCLMSDLPGLLNVTHLRDLLTVTAACLA